MLDQMPDIVDSRDCLNIEHW